MATPTKTVALVTDNALVALDLSATIEEVFPWANVVTLPAPLETPDEVNLLPDLLALIIDQREARTLDLDLIRRNGAAVIVIGDGEDAGESGVAFLPMPFTTEMLTSVLRVIARPDPV